MPWSGSPPPEVPVVLITGASSGIGAALAQEYARRGHRLVLLARRAAALAAVARTCEALGAPTRTVVGDVGVRADHDRAVGVALAQWGRLDIAVANAGIAVAGALATLPEDQLQRQLATNVVGVLHLVQAATPALAAQRGRIGIVGSVAGELPAPGSGAYALSKAAVRSLAMTLRAELRAQGLSVTLLTPGLIESEIRLPHRGGCVDPTARDPAPAWLVLPARRAARIMVRAIHARRRERVITLHGRLALLGARLLPGVVQLVIGRLARRW